MLGIKADNTDENYSKIDPMCYKRADEKVVEKYPNVQVVGNSLCEVASACLNNWQCVMMTRNGCFVSRKHMNLEIYSFASGLIWCLRRASPSWSASTSLLLIPPCATPSAMTGTWSSRKRSMT